MAIALLAGIRSAGAGLPRVCFAIALLSGCAGPLQEFTTHVQRAALRVGSATGVEDGRAQFRQLFCGFLRRDGIAAEEDCANWLHRLPDEPRDASAASAPREPAAPQFDIAIVPGIFGECVSGHVTILGDASARLMAKGYQVGTIPVRGRASSPHNATIVRDYVLGHAAARPARPLVLVAYSKGAPDSLVALAAYPEIRRHVRGLIAIAGVVNGTPLADGMQDLYERTVGRLPHANCPVVDQGEVRSLSRRERLQWLAANPLPGGIEYLSLVAMPSPDRVSAVLRAPYRRLSEVDPRNDSQVLHFDAILPAGMLLGYANADHWAIALPFETEAPVLAATLVDRNAFPRAQLIEAAVATMEERLALRRPAPL